MAREGVVHHEISLMLSSASVAALTTRHKWLASMLCVKFAGADRMVFGTNITFVAPSPNLNRILMPLR